VVLEPCHILNESLQYRTLFTSCRP